MTIESSKAGVSRYNADSDTSLHCITLHYRDNISIYKTDSGYSMVSEDGQDLSIPSHIDTTITLLATYSNGGLQVLFLFLNSGAWISGQFSMKNVMRWKDNYKITCNKPRSNSGTVQGQLVRCTLSNGEFAHDVGQSDRTTVR